MRPATRLDAEALWGPSVVAAALAERAPAQATKALVRRVAEAARASPGDGSFARWALALPWREFCGVVRIVTGATRRVLLCN